MGLIEIIGIIMKILAFVAGLFAPKTGVRQVAFITDFDCNPVVWTSAPVITGGEFVGTAEMRCQFDGKSGGGIMALRAHLESQLPKDGQVHGEPQVETYQGLPSLSYDMSLDMGQGTTARGTTHIATNGFTVLRNVFESHTIVASGNGKYLKGVYAEMDVRPTGETDVYELRAVQSLRVKKPVLTSSSQFKNSLIRESEQTLEERAIGAVQEMASHL